MKKRRFLTLLLEHCTLRIFCFLKIPRKLLHRFRGGSFSIQKNERELLCFSSDYLDYLDNLKIRFRYNQSKRVAYRSEKLLYSWGISYRFSSFGSIFLQMITSSIVVFVIVVIRLVLVFPEKLGFWFCYFRKVIDK